MSVTSCILPNLLAAVRLCSETIRSETQESDQASLWCWAISILSQLVSATSVEWHCSSKRCRSNCWTALLPAVLKGQHLLRISTLLMLSESYYTYICMLSMARGLQLVVCSTSDQNDCLHSSSMMLLPGLEGEMGCRSSDLPWLMLCNILT